MTLIAFLYEHEWTTIMFGFLLYAAVEALIRAWRGQ